MSKIVMNARATNGADDSIKLSGGEKSVTFSGTWDGATAQLSYAPGASSVFVDLTSGAFTADETKALFLGSGRLKATLSSAGTTAVNGYVD